MHDVRPWKNDRAPISAPPPLIVERQTDRQLSHVLHPEKEGWDEHRIKMQNGEATNGNENERKKRKSFSLENSQKDVLCD